MNIQNIKQNGNVVLYTDKHGNVELRADLEKDTIWATQDQIMRLFEIDQSVVSRHINNIIKDGEIDGKSNMQKMHSANSDRPITLYSLDIILSVGYRTNSKNAISFRRWATGVLRDYLTKGYAINQHKLAETREKFTDLQKAVALIESKSHRESLKGKAGDILELLSAYSKTLTILEQYDNETLTDIKGKRSVYKLTYEDSLGLIDDIEMELSVKGEANELFAVERGGMFEGVVKSVYQTFGGKELYPTIEDKAANLLYFVIKDHPFSDGNKRIGSMVFLYFLHRNRYLIRPNGERKINDTAMAALALLVAESDPKEKETIVKLTKNLVH